MKLKTKLSLLALSVSVISLSFAHDHSAKKTKSKSGASCEAIDITCAKTVTSAFAPEGKLWRLYSADKQMFYSVSDDMGKHFGQPVKVDIEPEKISAKGENRPKLGFDGQGNVYISWAKPLKKRFTAQVRLSWSTDGGKHFAKPITVNNDGLEIGHSFNEMLVAKDGEVTLTWLDGRERSKQPNYNGSALYLAQGRLRDGKFALSNTKLADQTCVCCRISMTYTADNKIAAMWRHIYDDNIRDHALLTFDKNTQAVKPSRVTFDQWQINGCPHQGPGLSIDQQNRYHMVWFNNGSKGKGLFYAYSDNGVAQQSKALSFGDLTAQASFAHVSSVDKTVDLVWTQFNGQSYQLLHKRSQDNGETFSKGTVISESTVGSDRPFVIKHNTRQFVSWHRPNLGHQVIAL